MLAYIKLLLPALTPSWRFFNSVGPSPRIEYALLNAPQDAAEWREFRPRAAVVRLHEMLRRLFWNPDRNDSLFLTSCAERLLETPTQHSLDEIATRIAACLLQGPPYLQFRIVLISRDARKVAYASAVRRRA